MGQTPFDESDVKSKELSLTARDRWIGCAVSLLVLACYLTLGSFRFTSIDEVTIFVTSRSLLGRGTLDADLLTANQSNGFGGAVVLGAGGHLYTIKEMMPAFLIAPLAWLGRLAGVSPIRTAFLLGPLAMAISVFLIYRLIRRLGYSERAGIFGSLLFGLGSLAWPYAVSMHAQSLATLGLVIALEGVVSAHQSASWRTALWAGLGLGFAGASTIAVLAAAPVYGLYLIRWEARRGGSWLTVLKCSIKPLATFGAGVAAWGVVIGATNALRFGSPFVTGYQANGLASQLLPAYFGLGAFGQLFSTPRGVIWYAPFTVLAPFGAAIGWKADRRSTLLFGGQAAALFVLYSCYFTWHAGSDWGPRYLVVIMPALALLTTPLLDRVIRTSSGWQRALVGVITGASILTQALARLVNSTSTEGLFYSEIAALTPESPFLAQGSPLLNPAYLPWVRLLPLIGSGKWDVLWMSNGTLDGLVLGALLLAIITGGAWLVASLRASQPGWLSRALAGQAAGSFVIICLMLARYPIHPPGYESKPTAALPDLDQAIEAIRRDARPGDQVVAILPYSMLAWIDRTDGSLPDSGFIFEKPLRDESRGRLERIAEAAPRVWSITERIDRGDTRSAVARWLGNHACAGAETTSDAYRVQAYTFPEKPVDWQPDNVLFDGGAIRLSGAWWEDISHPQGAWLNVSLRWEALKAAPAGYVVFVHVLDQAGALVAQHDGVPASSFAPTTGWQPGKSVADCHSVALPADLPAGDYVIRTGLYDPATGARVTQADGSDGFVIGTLNR